MALERPLTLWMISSEITPYAQTGGLGDVLSALPAALAQKGHRVRRFLPGYGQVDRTGFQTDPEKIVIPSGPDSLSVSFSSKKEPSGVITTLIECPELFGNRRGIYGDSNADFPDNARRFSLFSRAVCELAANAENPPDILHGHDWHAALVPLFAKFTCSWRRAPKTVFTIHNLGYQGRFPEGELQWLSLPENVRNEVFRMEGIEYFGDVNFLKAALLYSDKLTTVSPTYAREILTPEHGAGLDGVLRKRAADLSGILNGVDYGVWNPETDALIPRKYGASSSKEGKRAARAALEKDFTLPPSNRPLLGVVSRLVHQKGIDVFLEAVPALLEVGVDLAILGAGDQGLVDTLERLRRSFPGRIGVFIGYNERASHFVFAGSDALLVPSRYEPCGLTQLYALRYGTLPIAHRTGGLADSICDLEEDPSGGTGFLFSPLTTAALAHAVRRAVSLWRENPAEWRAAQKRAVEQEFSWDKAASRYETLYRQLVD
ncbi:MAG: glycogen synthase GlgA [Bdellovibrionota bacterium]